MEVLKEHVLSLIILTLTFATSFSSGFPLTYPTMCQQKVISSLDDYIIQSVQNNERPPVIFFTRRQSNDTTNRIGIVCGGSVKENGHHRLALPPEKEAVVVVNQKIFTALLWSISTFTLIFSGVLIIWALIYWEGSPWYRKSPKSDKESLFSEKSFGKPINYHPEFDQQQQKIIMV